MEADMTVKSMCFFDCQGNLVYKGKLSALPLNENAVIQRSIELFNDDEPCVIHKSFVIRNILDTIGAYFGEYLDNNIREMNWDDVSPNIRKYLDLPSHISKVILET